MTLLNRGRRPGYFQTVAPGVGDYYGERKNGIDNAPVFTRQRKSAITVDFETAEQLAIGSTQDYFAGKFDFPLFFQSN
jgi:hypothetical protein